jgi:NADPH:quinone reductase-like Zn-dependent oxidoreductase
MQTIQLSAYGDPRAVLELVTIPDPGLPPLGHVLVAVEYAPINPPDFLLILGMYGSRPVLPVRPGSEGVGIVIAVGEKVQNLRIGDRVLIPFEHNSWSEQVTLAAADLFALPKEADPRQLAMAGGNPPTAALMLSEYVDLAPGDWVLQDAANSGVGRSVIAFAKERGLRTINIVRRDELIPELLAAGADIVLIDGPDIAKRAADASRNAPIKLGLDCIGGELMSSITRTLAPRSTLIIFGFKLGKLGIVNAADIIFKEITIRGFWINHDRIRHSPKWSFAKREAVRLIAENKLHVPIAATYPLGAFKEAIQHALHGGKVLFEVSARAQ